MHRFEGHLYFQEQVFFVFICGQFHISDLKHETGNSTRHSRLLVCKTGICTQYLRLEFFVEIITPSVLYA